MFYPHGLHTLEYSFLSTVSIILAALTFNIYLCPFVIIYVL